MIVFTLIVYYKKNPQILPLMMLLNKTTPVYSMATMVGECIDDCHPEWCDHYMIVFIDAKGEMFRQWLPSVLGLEIRRGDLILMSMPINWGMPVITGILSTPPQDSANVFPVCETKSHAVDKTRETHKATSFADEPESQGNIARKNDRASFEVRPNNTVALTGETPIQVVSHNGRKLVEIGIGPDGPTIRVCQRDAVIDLPGKLTVSAGELELKSRSGDLKIEADHDVVVQGDLIRLN